MANKITCCAEHTDEHVHCHYIYKKKEKFMKYLLIKCLTLSGAPAKRLLQGFKPNELYLIKEKIN